MNASVQGDSILLNDHLFLDKRVNLLFEEVAFVDIVGLKLLEITVQVVDVFNDFLKDVVSRFGCVVLQGRALAAQQLHLLLVVIEILNGFFCVSLLSDTNMNGD